MLGDCALVTGNRNLQINNDRKEYIYSVLHHYQLFFFQKTTVIKVKNQIKKRKDLNELAAKQIRPSRNLR